MLVTRDTGLTDLGLAESRHVSTTAWSQQCRAGKYARRWCCGARSWAAGGRAENARWSVRHVGGSGDLQNVAVKI